MTDSSGPSAKADRRLGPAEALFMLCAHIEMELGREMSIHEFDLANFAFSAGRQYELGPSVEIRKIGLDDTEKEGLSNEL